MSVVTDGLVMSLDAGNPACYSPNVIPYPTDLFFWTGPTGVRCTLERDESTSSPVGQNPLKMTVTSTDPYTATRGSTSFNLAEAKAGQLWTLSFWAKSDEPTTGQGFIFESDSGGTDEFTAVSFNIDSNWQRFSLSRLFTGSDTNAVQVRLDGPQNDVGKIVWFDGLQLEKSDSMTDFNPNYYGDGKKLVDLSNPENRDNEILDRDNNGNTLYKSDSPKYFEMPLTNGYTSNEIGHSQVVFQDQEEYSLDFWVKSNSSTGVNVNQSLWGRRSTRPWGYVALRDTDDGSVWEYVHRTLDNSFYGVLTTGINIKTDWVNICVTYDSRRIMSVYVNGELQGTRTLSNTQATLNKWMSGYASGTNFQHFRGGGTTYKIYNRPLGDKEIKQNFEALRARHGV